jgi:hypothetical protein
MTATIAPFALAPTAAYEYEPKTLSAALMGKKAAWLDEYAYSLVKPLPL